MNLCSIGGKYGYFDTLKKAGIPVPLDEGVVKETAAFCEKHAEELKAKL